jgi:hypothetical protein
VDAGRSTKPQEPRLRRRMLQIRAIECLGIEADGSCRRRSLTRPEAGPRKPGGVSSFSSGQPSASTASKA